MSGLVTTEENWRLSIFALSHEVDFKNSSSLKGATPDASFFLLFMKLHNCLVVPCLCSTSCLPTKVGDFYNGVYGEISYLKSDSTEISFLTTYTRDSGRYISYVAQTFIIWQK